VGELACGLKAAGISVAIDTCGYAPRPHFTRLLPHTDLFLYDVKLMDPVKHREFTGESNELILDNLGFLFEQGAAVDLRLTLIDGVNDDDGYIQSITEWLRERRAEPRQITLLSYHNFGREKYAKLGRQCTQNYKKPDEQRLMQIKEYLANFGYLVSLN